MKKVIIPKRENTREVERQFAKFLLDNVYGVEHIKTDEEVIEILQSLITTLQSDLEWFAK